MNIARRLLGILHLPMFLYAFLTKSLFRKMFVAFFLAITTTVTTLGFYYFNQISSDIKKREISNMEKLSEQSASRLETQMANIKSVAWDYFSDSRFQRFVMDMGSDPDTYSDYSGKFSQLIADNSAVEFIMVSDLNGYRMIKGNIDVIDVLDLDKMKAISISSEGKGVWYPSETYNKQLGKTVNTLTFVQSIRRISILSDSPVVGVLMIQLSYDHLSQWLGSIGAEELGQYMLIDSTTGKVQMAADRSIVGSRLNNFHELVTFGSQNPVKHQFIQDQGEDTLYVSHRLANTSWVLVGMIPLRVLLRQVNVLAGHTMMIGMLFLFCAMVLASVISSRISVPLKELQKGIRSIEKGDYSVSILVQSKDELGYIIHRFNQMAAEIKSLIVKVYEADLVKKDAEIKSLQFQINPHFLYNTLGIIDSLASIQEDDRISRISSSLAKMFRYNISAGRMVALQAEVGQIQMYLYIQQQRFTERLCYSIEIEQGLENIHIPKLVIQPLVENCFIHAIDHMTSLGEIRVRSWSLSDKEVYISVWNNGPAIDPAGLEKLQAELDKSELQHYSARMSSSIGLLNVQHRLRLVYGPEYGLTIHSSLKEGTEVLMHIRRLGEEEMAYEAVNRR